MTEAPATPEAPRGLSRRQALALFGVGAGVLITEQALAADGTPPGTSTPQVEAIAPPEPGGYAPDGTAGRAAALPLSQVQLLDSPFRQNQARNTTYLLFLDPERMLRSFRLNYGENSEAEPLGGWEKPDSQIRGHMTGHLLSALALTYANTGDLTTRTRGRYLVSQLSALQAKARDAGFHHGYLSAFPEFYFDWAEQGKPVWSPYYMIHKYLAGMIDQYQLAGDDQALDVAQKLADWVDWRTSTGSPGSAGRRRRHPARAAGQRDHAEDHRLRPDVGGDRQRQVPRHRQELLVHRHRPPRVHHRRRQQLRTFQMPDTVAAQLSNFTCENCVSYNLLKLTRLLHFHEPQRVDMLDYYERTLFNQMLGEQDPGSPHGFNCYYTGLSAGAFKRQPLNYFRQGDPEVYATDWDTFTCDTATGIETQAKFADTIYSRDADGLWVNLFIPSQVTLGNLVLRQDTGIPDDPVVRLSVVAGAATLTLRVRVPKWVADSPMISLNGAPLRDLPAAAPSTWITLRRPWRAGDVLEVTLPMQLAVEPTPDHPAVQALTYGPVVLSGVYGSDPGSLTPQLELPSVQRTATHPMTFEAVANSQPVRLIPVARAAHEYYTRMGGGCFGFGEPYLGHLGVSEHHPWDRGRGERAGR